MHGRYDHSDRQCLLQKPVDDAGIDLPKRLVVTAFPCLPRMELRMIPLSLQRCLHLDGLNDIISSCLPSFRSRYCSLSVLESPCRDIPARCSRSLKTVAVTWPAGGGDGRPGRAGTVRMSLIATDRGYRPPVRARTATARSTRDDVNSPRSLS